MNAVQLATPVVAALARAGLLHEEPVYPTKSEAKLRDGAILADLARHLAAEGAKTGDDRMLAKAVAAWRSARAARGLSSDVEAALLEIENKVLCFAAGIPCRLADTRPMARTAEGADVLHADAMRKQAAIFAWAAARFESPHFAAAAARTIAELRAEPVRFGAIGHVQNPQDAA